MVETITNHNSKNLQTSKYRYDNDIQKLMEVRIVVLYVNTIFNNISVLLVRETGVSCENHWPATSHWLTLSHNVVSSTPHYDWDLSSQH